jgi:ABC-type lipoprotein export system ATPase subunit
MASPSWKGLSEATKGRHFISQRSGLLAGSNRSDGIAISFEAVTKAYSSKGEPIKALDGVSFEVEAGAIVAVVGPSGSGKTTLLNMAAALDFPTQGSVKVVGFVTSSLEKEALQRFRNETVGVVFQQFFLIGHLTVFQNVMVPLIPRRLPSEEKSRRILDSLAKVGLADKAERLPSELSGGELQRAAIARGIVGDAPVILADEPTGNLDHRRAADVMDILFAESREGKKTVLIATHDLRMLDRADGAVYLEDGVVAKLDGRRVQQIGA